MTNTKLTYILHALLIFALVVLGLYSLKLKGKVDELLAQEPQTITDTVTLTEVQFDSVFFHHIAIDTFKVVDTAFIVDTVDNTVYIPVEVPLHTHIFDTLVAWPFCTTSLQGSLGVDVHGAVTGYRATLDTLVLDYKLDAAPVPLKRKFRVLPAVGVGYGTGGLGAFIGIGFSYY